MTEVVINDLSNAELLVMMFLLSGVTVISCRASERDAATGAILFVFGLILWFLTLIKGY